jgi:hypothetical protein
MSILDKFKMVVDGGLDGSLKSILVRRDEIQIAAGAFDD